MKKYSAELQVTVSKAERCNILMDEIQQRYDSEYQSFFTERKRWKSDFQAASERAVNNFNQIEDLMNKTLTENAVNTNALKLLLDAVMIDQLIARQDIEDRKQIAVMGTKPTNELLQTNQQSQSPKRLSLKPPAFETENGDGEA